MHFNIIFEKTVCLRTKFNFDANPLPCFMAVVIFYGPQGHPYDCFPTGSMYVYIYNYIIYIFLCPLTRVCVVYVVKEVTSFVKERAIIDQALHSSRKKSV